jgi:hypothetical protein
LKSPTPKCGSASPSWKKPSPAWRINRPPPSLLIKAPRSNQTTIVNPCRKKWRHRPATLSLFVSISVRPWLMILFPIRAHLRNSRLSPFPRFPPVQSPFSIRVLPVFHPWLPFAYFVVKCHFFVPFAFFVFFRGQSPFSILLLSISGLLRVSVSLWFSYWFQASLGSVSSCSKSFLLPLLFYPSFRIRVHSCPSVVKGVSFFAPSDS